MYIYILHLVSFSGRVGYFVFCLETSRKRKLEEPT